MFDMLHWLLVTSCSGQWEGPFIHTPWDLFTAAGRNLPCTQSAGFPSGLAMDGKAGGKETLPFCLEKQQVHDMRVTTVDISASGRTRTHKLLQLVPLPQQLPHTTAAGDLRSLALLHPFCSPLFAKWLTPVLIPPQKKMGARMIKFKRTSHCTDLIVTCESRTGKKKPEKQDTESRP